MIDPTAPQRRIPVGIREGIAEDAGPGWRADVFTPLTSARDDRSLKRSRPGERRARIGLKFPNDLLDRNTGRKFGGILVEVIDGVAVVGIGLNLGRRTWPPDVPATSL